MWAPLFASVTTGGVRILIGMYRDDAGALLARVDALQLEVDQLRAQLARAPEARATPPEPPREAWWRRRKPADADKPAHLPRVDHVPVPSPELVHRVTQMVDLIGEPPLDDRIVRISQRLRGLSSTSLAAIEGFIEQLVTDDRWSRAR